jgi:hypothetical protein
MMRFDGWWRVQSDLWVTVWTSREGYVLTRHKLHGRSVLYPLWKLDHRDWENAFTANDLHTLLACWVALRLEGTLSPIF